MKRDVNLDVLRILAAIMVVLIHTSSYLIKNYDNHFLAVVIDGFSRVSVPIFVIISGYFLNSIKDVSIWSFYKKRFSQILLPFIFYSFIYAFFKYCKSFVVTDFHFNPLKDFVEGDSYYHLWFMYMIIPIYVIIPFLLRVIERISLFHIGVLIVFFQIKSIYFNNLIEFDLTIFEYNISWIESFVNYLQYFLLGNLISKIRIDISRYRFLFAILYFASSLFVVFYNPIYNSYYSFPVFIGSISLFLFFKSLNFEYKKAVEHKIICLSNLTFGVYLIHPLFLDVGEFFIYEYLKLQNEINNSLILFITSIMTIYFSFKVLQILSRFKWVNKIAI